MARVRALMLIFLVFFASFPTQLEGRKLLIAKQVNEKEVPSLFRSLVLSALSKGTVPYSAPSKKGHATLDNEKLFNRHLSSIDRILRSVPSPGVGH
ncbi:hypothetical protein SLEP1_g6127 [Rubroshorea leprosula]|uniref:Uncharacterized protein n=1 Tax=Rubroshorea leprosula TaxID=152421 RepID=A0AAV5I4U5_9ROSI|nr:hypothetical protein SLEP1_g6127 [Rubroshorea leprosula]